MSWFKFDGQAQVLGINTLNPAATLDIVSAGSTGSTKALKITNSSSQDIVTVLDNGWIGLGTSLPKVRLDLRNSGLSDNQGIGIGSTTAAAPAVGGGVLRYDNTYDELQFSDGSRWNIFQVNQPRVCAVANNTSAITFPTNTAVTMNNWTSIHNPDGYFDPLNGVFTAPKRGIYSIYFGLLLTRQNIAANSNVRVSFVTSRGKAYNYEKAYPLAGFIYVGVNWLVSIEMYAGEKLHTEVYHTLGATHVLRTVNAAFNRFAIVIQE